MKFIFWAVIFCILQSCTHNQSRTNASEAGSISCGTSGSVEDRIRNCSWVKGYDLPVDFVLVSRLAEKEMMIGGFSVYKDTSTGLLWTKPVKFSGELGRAIDFCSSEATLKESFSDFTWRLPTDQEIKSIYNKRSRSMMHDMHDRVLGSKVIERSDGQKIIVYYDYHLTGDLFAPLKFNEKESVILCVSEN